MTTDRPSLKRYDDFWALFGADALDQWRAARGAFTEADPGTVGHRQSMIDRLAPRLSLVPGPATDGVEIIDLTDETLVPDVPAMTESAH